MIDIEQLLAYLNLEEFTNIFVYYQDEAIFRYYSNGRFVNTEIPDFLKRHLLNDSISLYLFRKNNNILTFYFFRLNIQNKQVVVIIQDSKDGKYLNKFISSLFENLWELKVGAVQLNKEIDFLRDELNVCEKELNEKEQEVNRLNELLSAKETLLESLEESVSILKRSRQKMLKLIDGFNMPFFSMDTIYDLNNVNLAAGKFAGETNLPRLVGGKCFKMIYNFPEPCKWCKYEEIKQTKNCVKQHIHYEKDGVKFVFEQSMFPIFDQEGNLIEVGEYINDITHQYEILESLRKSEQELVHISRKNIESINEIGALKKAYEDLSNEYENAKAKIAKLTSVLNTLVQQDTVNELLKLRGEKKELEIKLVKALTTIKNFTRKHEENESKIESMAKKSLYSMERLLNIINNKKKIDDEELKKVFDFLSGQILYIKQIIEKQEEKDESKSSN
ncbi:PAS domain-containing protein [Calditerrivibrio sp.]|uniref:PAS domain-containing protein n=1 Tax=Calditerrivibrio sp. TaxID=2792612 RepID=UPI003D09B59C